MISLANIPVKSIAICATIVVVALSCVYGYSKFISYMDKRDQEIRTSAINGYKEELKTEQEKKRLEDESKKSGIKSGLKDKKDLNAQRTEQSKQKIDQAKTEQEFNDSYKEAMKCLIESC